MMGFMGVGRFSVTMRVVIMDVPGEPHQMSCGVNHHVTFKAVDVIIVVFLMINPL